MMLTVESFLPPLGSCRTRNPRTFSGAGGGEVAEVEELEVNELRFRFVGISSGILTFLR